MHVVGSVPGQVSAANYPVLIKASYDDGSGGIATAQKSVGLTMQNCFNVANQNIAANETEVSVNLDNLVNDTIQPDGAFAYSVVSQSNAALVDCGINGNMLTCTVQGTNVSGTSTVVVSASSGVYLTSPFIIIRKFSAVLKFGLG